VVTPDEGNSLPDQYGQHDEELQAQEGDPDIHRLRIVAVDAQKAFSEQMYYAPTVEGVKLNEDASKRVVQPDSDALLEMDWSWMAEHRDAWTEDWKREVIQ
jgi:hypothetical protein